MKDVDSVSPDGTLPGLTDAELAGAGLANTGLAKAGLASAGRKRPRRPSATSQLAMSHAARLAEHLPVARVWLDLQPAHLDRDYEYAVPASLAATAMPGVRIRARFGSQEVDGFILERTQTAQHDGPLTALKRVVSPVPVLTADTMALVHAVAQRWAGTTSDVLRLAIPKRHARTEQEFYGAGVGAVTGQAALGQEGQVLAHQGLPDLWLGLWSHYQAGEAFIARVRAGLAPKAVWTPLPGLAPLPPEPPLAAPACAVPPPAAVSHEPSGELAGEPAGQAGMPSEESSIPHWAAAIAVAAHQTVESGRRVLIVAPDERDVGRIVQALHLAQVPHVVPLQAADGPALRYRSYLMALTGQAQVLVGTRAAAFAPLPQLGLMVVWGDGEQTLAEPRAPYPHVRDLLALRSDLESVAFIVGSQGRTVQGQYLVDSGWAHHVTAGRELLRTWAPRVRALTSANLAFEGAAGRARIPSTAWKVAKQALTQGPVLVQVPRAGYVPLVACARCREAAHCLACHGPLALLAGQEHAPQCRWCGRLEGHWLCPHCGNWSLRAVRVGTGRTAEELGRAFPGVPVLVSSAQNARGVIDAVSSQPALVVATPGAEPCATGGYSAALILDAALATTGMGLDTGTQALHRWLAAAHLVRPAALGGQVLLVGDAAPGPTQALVRFDPVTFAQRELAERMDLHLQPAVRVAALTGHRQAVAAVLARVDLATSETTLGPVDLDLAQGPDVGKATDQAAGAAALLFDEPLVRTVVRVPLESGLDLARQLRASMSIRSARREAGTVRVHMDPDDLL